MSEGESEAPRRSRIWRIITTQPLAVQLVGGATATLIAGLITAGAAVAVNEVRAGSGNESSPPGAPVPRSPRLGLEIWQSGRQAPMSVSGDENRHVTVQMKRAPFELRLPHQPKGMAVQICAWTDSSIFSLQEDGLVRDVPFFRPGTGMPDSEYGSGRLRLENEAHNHFVDERIAPLSSAMDKVSFTTMVLGHASTVLQRQRADVFLTVFIDKNRDGRIGPNRGIGVQRLSEFEYVVLDFPK
ncbi:hypothetical protein [Actinomadura rugatobispora]|uniref:Uncharacterized protein n=1 Tax=Actinomadura rugatobispora TaxID=1994 RepID=A0ABW1AHQ4_9ACTN|nr:hypothetical protein GCM10010200_067880 [Actinomadura rugatobispora]